MHGGRYFLLTEGRREISIRPLPRWRAILWLYRNPPEREALIESGLFNRLADA